MTNVTYHFTEIDGHRVFHREAGHRDAATVLLLHGAPASSHMFRHLIPLLADRYHVIAPDYLGFGLSDSPAVDEYDYSFDALTDVTAALLERLGCDRYAMYVQDYGAPVGWRLALRNPGQVTAIISQNGNAYTEGFGPVFWDSLWAYAERPGPETERPLRQALTLDAFRWQYQHGVPNVETVSPDAWMHDFHALQRPGNAEVQLALFRDHPANVRLYPAVQRYFRETQVPLLAAWGRNDQIFVPAGARAFQRDLPAAEIQLIDGGHWLLESQLDTVAGYLRGFLGRVTESG
jgi:pimeloyl-ACP methyl ester carboxylesterase